VAVDFLRVLFSESCSSYFLLRTAFRTPFRRAVTNGGLSSASEVSRNGQRLKWSVAVLPCSSSTPKAQTMLCHRGGSEGTVGADFDSSARAIVSTDFLFSIRHGCDVVPESP
jgi:hypothetical protein